MTITFNTPTASFSGTGTTSKTFSHTSDGNPLIVRVHLRGAPTNVTVTYNGTSVPLVTGCEKLQASSIYAGFFYLSTPATGTYDVVVSWAGSSSYYINAVNISGAGSPVNGTSAGGDSTTPSVSVSSATGSLVLDAVAFYSTGTLSVGASQTQQYNQNTAGGAPLSGAGSYESGAASVTMSWTSTAGDAWAIVGCSFPAPATASAQVIWFS